MVSYIKKLDRFTKLDISNSGPRQGTSLRWKVTVLDGSMYLDTATNRAGSSICILLQMKWNIAYSARLAPSSKQLFSHHYYYSATRNCDPFPSFGGLQSYATMVL